MPAIEELAVSIWICGAQPRIKMRVRARSGLPCMLSSRLEFMEGVGSLLNGFLFEIPCNCCNQLRLCDPCVLFTLGDKGNW